EEGSLEVLRGEFARSRPLLREAVAGLESQDPLNLNDLPRALLNLAVVELVTDRQGRAKELGQRCQRLYQAHRLPDDLLLVEVDNLLGACAAQEGDYAQAISHFREGEKRCGQLGPGADPQRSNLLLNMALLHKAQGEPDEALRLCEQARDLFRGFAR